MSEEKINLPWAVDEDEPGTDLAPVNLESGLRNLAASTSLAGSGGGADFMAVDTKTGLWRYGVERTEVEPESIWILDTRTLKHGWNAWRERELVAEILVPISQASPTPAALGDYQNEAKQCFSVEMVCGTGEDQGTKVLYKVNSVGGADFFKAYVTALAQQLGRDPKTPYVFPAMHLKSDSYNHPTWGTTFKPIFRPLYWVDRGGESEKPVSTSQVSTGRPAAAVAETRAAAAAGKNAAPAEAPAPSPRRGKPQPDPEPPKPAAPAASRRRRVAS